MTDDTDLIRLAEDVGQLTQQVERLEDLQTRVTTLEGRGTLSPACAADTEARYQARQAAQQDHQQLVKQVRNNQIALLVGLPTTLILGAVANALLMPHVISLVEHGHL